MIGAAAHRAYFGSHLLRLRFRRAIIHCDIGALAREAQGDAAADSLGRTGNECDLPLKMCRSRHPILRD
jgi:hypothetical protein